MFSDLWSKIKELVRKMLPKKNIQEVLQVNPCVSDKMGDAIELWSNMYIGEAPWLKEPTYEERIQMLEKHYNFLKEKTNERKALLDIKTHALAYLKFIPKSKELKNEIVTCKTEEDFKNCINKIYEHIKYISCEKQEKNW